MIKWAWGKDQVLEETFKKKKIYLYDLGLIVRQFLLLKKKEKKSRVKA